MRIRRLTAAALVMAVGVTGMSTSAWAAPDRQQVAGERPAWAGSSGDAGPVAAASQLDARVYLAGRDPTGLTAYAAAVSDPASASYRHYLTPGQARARFGPTADQVQRVRGWLAGAGLTVTAVTDHYVAVRGSAAAAGRAFGTRLERFRTADGVQRAPASAVTVPAVVAPAVLTVTGLSTSAARMASDLATTSVPGPCSTYYGQRPATELPPAYGHTLPYLVCGYTPAQLRAAYQVDRSGLTGRGQTVAIVVGGASPTIVSDTDTYSQRHGLPVLRPGQLTQNLPTDIGQCGPEGNPEETLDVEAVHTMAPAAHITYVAAGCATTYPTEALDAETRIVDGHLASIVSDSWHLGTEAQMTPDLVTAYQRTFQLGAVEGIGFYFSSGDHGDWSTSTPDHRPAVQYPGSDPWVTGVGGTSLAIDSHQRYQWEAGWGLRGADLTTDRTGWVDLPGTHFQGGAGGGPSALFAQPSYQRHAVPNALSHPAGATDPVRVMPDIAADADPDTGMLIGLSGYTTTGYAELRAGGTSLATPLIAGLQADAQQAQHGIPLGFANPALYARYRTGAYRDVTDTPLGPDVPLACTEDLLDPTSGAILTARAFTTGLDQSLHATRGYDDITGLGTPARHYLDTYRTP